MSLHCGPVLGAISFRNLPRTLCIPDPHPEFSPACPIPYVIQPSGVEQLKTFLQNEVGKAQRINVEALIRLYENGDLKSYQPGEAPVYLVDGRIVDKDPWEDPSVPSNAIKWCEVRLILSANDTGTCLPDEYGGDEELTRPFLVCNDTRGDTLTLFDSDLVALSILHSTFIPLMAPLSSL
ncbi:unnamed protein product [Penicillium nalgiovense]|nr:unnamed protein product [Penicillium nalgiovense]